MAKARKKRQMEWVGWVVAALLLCVAIGWGLQLKKTAVLNPTAFEGPLSNPMTGFAPHADYYEIVGNNRLVYADVTWADLEPQEGRFDFESFERDNHLDEWRVKGKQVVFRFLCDVPGDTKHMDIPQWLYDATGGDGTWYDIEYGKGFSPNYNNQIIIDKHRRVIQALGQRYGNDDFFCYIEFGSLGHWGEWHTKHDAGITPLPLETVREEYVRPYLESFPRAMFLMRRPFRTAARYQMGLYNDMTGQPVDTMEWLGWIQNGGEYGETGEAGALVPMRESWKTSPVGGEMTSAIPMGTMLQENLEQTLDLIRQSHMTFIGPKSPVLPDDLQYEKGVQAILSILGSRLRVAQALLQEPLLLQGDLTVTLDWVNDGSAPFYQGWDVVLVLLDDNGSEMLRSPVEVDIRSIVDATAVKTVTILPTQQLRPGSYTLAVAMLDPDTGLPAYHFAMEGTRPDLFYTLGSWEKD